MVNSLRLRVPMLITRPSSRTLRNKQKIDYFAAHYEIKQYRFGMSPGGWHEREVDIPGTGFNIVGINIKIRKDEKHNSTGCHFHRGHCLYGI